MLAVEPAEQGYNASYIYCDEETMYIARDQMKLLEGRLPQKEDEVVVSRYFLSNYGADAGSGYDPADYRAYVHFKNEQQMDETELTARSREIAKEYQLEMPVMNLSYMKFYKQPVNVSMLALVAGIAVLVIIGGYVVIQSIFRISINDKIQSYGQLRTNAKADPEYCQKGRPFLRMGWYRNRYFAGMCSRVCAVFPWVSSAVLCCCGCFDCAAWQVYGIHCDPQTGKDCRRYLSD